MALRRKRQELIPERKHPGDPEPDWCSPGSIEQQLDMCDKGSLRGDEVQHSHGTMSENWEMDLAEDDREGSEMSGDEHSSGLEGGEPELEGQVHTTTGLPGDRTRREQQESRTEGIPQIPLRIRRKR